MSKISAHIDRARNMELSVELARRGAGVTLITTLIGFSERFVRTIVQEEGGARPTRTNDARKWLCGEPDRLLHGQLLLVAYGKQPVSDPVGLRLLSAYDAYRSVAPASGVLDINHCYSIILLHQKGAVYTRRCTCGLPFTYTERHGMACPVCCMLERVFCRVCDKYLDFTDAVIKQGRRYCDGCAKDRRRARTGQRRSRQITIRHVEPSKPMKSAPAMPMLFDDLSREIRSGRRA